MKDRIGMFSLTAILVLSVWLLSGCRSVSTPSPTPTASADLPAASGLAGAGELTALGTLRPARVMQLSFGAGGPVRKVSARVGVEVKAGDLLAELDTTALQIELQTAQEEVAARQAVVDGLADGPRPELAERAGIEHARQVAEAEIALQVSRWQLEQARLGDHGPAIAIAQAQRDQSALVLVQARALFPATEVAVARIGLARAQDALDQARIAYSKALDRPWEPQEVRDAHAKAILEAEREVQLAQARLDGALSAQRAHTFGIEASGDRVREAEARLAQALDARDAYSVTLSLLSAEVELAELRLEGLQAWENPYLDPSSPREIAQADARLRQAELAVAKLEWQLRGAEIRAPFDGVISVVYRSPGEWSAPGEPVLELLDISRWHVETRNVGELNISRVQVGEKVSVRVIAFRDQELEGRILTISPAAVVQQGDTTYTLIVELQAAELRLRSGMNVEVAIPIE